MQAVAACESDASVGHADGRARVSWMVKCSIVGFFDLIQAWHDSNNGRLEIRHDSSVGLTVARSHHQKQSDKRCLELHVDDLCMDRVSSVPVYCTTRLVQRSGPYQSR